MTTTSSRRCARRALLALCLTCAAASAAAARDLTGVVTRNGRPAAQVVVWLESSAPAPAPRRIVLDQRNLQFSPHVLAVPVGTTVEMPNSDRVFHNVFSFRDGKVFDLGLYPVGSTRTVVFDRPGLSRIFCNIHPNMAAYVLAVNSSDVAVSNGDGAIAMPGVRDGIYTYHAWRAGAPIVTGSLTVTAGAVVDLRLP